MLPNHQLKASVLILLVAVVAGLIAGIGRAKARGNSFRVPPLRHYWLLLVAFLPQLPAFYLPATRGIIADDLAAAALVSSQLLLLLFGWWNRRQRAFALLLLGLFCNFLVIVSNGGLMPMSPATVAKLVSPERAATWAIGERLGHTKDRLLPEAETRFALLSDRMLLPKWMGYAVAYSIGDVLIALGAFWLLWAAGNGKPATRTVELIDHAEETRATNASTN